MAPVVHALKATLALVHPVSSGFVTHRLLQSLIPVLWFRLVFEFLFMPFLVDFNLAGNVWDWATTQPASAEPTTTANTQGTDGAEGDLLINTFGTANPTPSGTVPSDIAQSDVAEQGSDTEQDEEEPFLNRAERRAQQREDKRNQHARAASAKRRSGPSHFAAGLLHVQRIGETHVDSHLCGRSCCGGCCGIRADPTKIPGSEHCQSAGRS